jgi:hypothetical protein
MVPLMHLEKEAQEPGVTAAPADLMELFKLSTPSQSKLTAMVVIPGARLVHQTRRKLL